jgi:predicted RNase H-like HicB family nuclease
MLYTAIIHREEEWYVAECPEVGTASQGETIEAAIENLREATALYLAEFPARAPSHPQGSRSLTGTESTGLLGRALCRLQGSVPMRCRRGSMTSCSLGSSPAWFASLAGSPLPPISGCRRGPTRTLSNRTLQSTPTCQPRSGRGGNLAAAAGAATAHEAVGGPGVRILGWTYCTGRNSR